MNASRRISPPTGAWGAWGAWAANAVKSTTETFSEQEWGTLLNLKRIFFLNKYLLIHIKANAIADRSINVLAEASEYMQRDLEEFTKVVSEDATNVYSKVAEVTYQSINDYAGEEIAQDAVNIKSVSLISFKYLKHPIKDLFYDINY